VEAAVLVCAAKVKAAESKTRGRPVVSRFADYTIRTPR
jgi:hypothetical protein